MRILKRHLTTPGVDALIMFWVAAVLSDLGAMAIRARPVLGWVIAAFGLVALLIAVLKGGIWLLSVVRSEPNDPPA